MILYRLGDSYASSLTTTFLVGGVGFSQTEVGLVNKGLSRRRPRWASHRWGPDDTASSLHGTVDFRDPNASQPRLGALGNRGR